MKIVHIDDHALFVEGLKAILGHDIHTASNAEEGLLLAEQHPDADLILVDLGLPGMDGQALLKALFARGVVAPVAIMSAAEDNWKIKRCLDEGAMGFIPKALPVQHIKLAIERIMAGHFFLPDDLKTRLDQLPDIEPEEETARIAASHHITRRQLDVLRLMQQGYGNQEIANILFLSEHTVKSHVKALLRNFHAANRVECVRCAERAGLLGQVAH